MRLIDTFGRIWNVATVIPSSARSAVKIRLPHHITFLTPNGSRFWSSITVLATVSRGGKVCRSTVHDVTTQLVCARPKCGELTRSIQRAAEDFNIGKI